MKNWKIEAIILAIGFVLLGLFIKSGLNNVSGNDRVVNVKGLAEMEVEANHMLSAVVNGHLIQAGTKHVGIYSYINVNGNQIAKKIRWV